MKTTALALKGIGSYLIKKKWAYLFILPNILIFLAFIVYPVLYSFLLSFQEYGVWGNEWIGLDNFFYLFSDYVFWQALKNTAIVTVVMVPLGIIVALLLASFLHPLSERVKGFFRMAYYLPGVASGVVMGMIWRWLYDPNFGLFNLILEKIGVAAQPWLTSPKTALGSLMLMIFMAAPGTAIILYLSAMKKIPKELYEAAEIDGAGSIIKWFKITLPLVKATTLYLVIINTIASFQIFTQIFVMTQGGPGYSTYTLVYQIYMTAFRDFEFGLASAQAMILFAIISIFSVLQFKFLSSDVEY